MLSSLVSLSTFSVKVGIASVKLVGNITSFIRFSMASSFSSSTTLNASVSLLFTPASTSASPQDYFGALCLLPSLTRCVKYCLPGCRQLPLDLSATLILLHHIGAMSQLLTHDRMFMAAGDFPNDNGSTKNNIVKLAERVFVSSQND